VCPFSNDFKTFIDLGKFKDNIKPTYQVKHSVMFHFEDKSARIQATDV